MFNRFHDKRKLVGGILGIILFGITIMSITFAYYSWRSSDTAVTFTISDSIFTCETDLDSSVSSLAPVTDYRSGTYQVFSVKNVGRSDTTFSLSMNITSISDVLKHESFKYKLMLDPTNGSRDCSSTSVNNCELVGEGNFKNVKVGMNTLVQSINLPNNSRYRYYFFMYLDGNMSNPTGIQNGSMTSSLGVCDVYTFFDVNTTCVDDTSVDPKYKKLTVDSTYGELPRPTRQATISFNSNGGSSASNQVVDFDFGGWFRNAQGTGSAVTSNTPVTAVENETLYAKWTAHNSIILPTVTKEGYDFVGWYSDSSYTTRIGGSGDSYTPNCSVTLYAAWIKTNDITSTTNYKVKSQTATLGCSSDVNITAWYFGTNSNPADSAFTTISPVKTFSKTNQNVGTVGTYYLICRTKDNIRTYTKPLKTYISYNVYNMRDKVAGTAGTYTTENYDTVSSDTGYIIPSGTTATTANLYTVPGTINTQVVYAGRNAAAPSTSNASLTTGTTAFTIASGTSYTFWFNRKTYTLTLNKGTGISAVTGAGTYKWGASVNIDATVTNGYTWVNWTTGTSTTQYSATKATTVTMGTSNLTYKANAKDATGPVAEIVASGTTANYKVKSQTISLKCTDAVGVTAWYFGTSSSPADSAFTTVTTTTSWTKTDQTVASAGTYYLICKDAATNVSNKPSKVYISYNVYNMRDKVAGTAGTYTTGNYDTVSSDTGYIIPSGTTATPANLYTVPGTINTQVVYVGRNAAAPSTSNASLTTGTASFTIESGKSYTFWFNRKTYTLTLNKGTGISAVTGAGTYKWGASVNIDATVTNGYTWVNWTTGTSTTQYSATKATTVTMGTSNLVYKANAKDATGPVAEIVASGTTANYKVKSQTVSLKCTDAVGVTAWYFGTSSSPADSAFTTVTSTTSWTKTDQTVTAAGTYYLICKDAGTGNTAPNVSNKPSKVYISYNVYNMRDKVAGTAGTYTTGNYDTVSSDTGYIIPSGTTATPANLYTVPGTINTQVAYIGYNAASPSTSNASLTTATTAFTIASGTSYTFWFNRKTYTLTLNKGTGISAVTGAGTYKWGATVNIDATVTNGYTWVNWTTGTSTTQYSATKATTVTMGTSNLTYKANAKDATGPVAEIVASGTTANYKVKSQTISLKCTDAVGVTAWYFGTSSSPADSAFTTVTSTTSWTKTDQTVTAAGTYYLICKDAATNVSNKPSKVYISYNVYNMRDKVAGTVGTYTTGNYDTVSSDTGYIIPSGTTATPANLYTVPGTINTQVVYAGRNAAAPSTSNASLTTGTGSFTIASGTSYTFWFNRKTYTLTLNKGTGNGISAVTGAGTYKWGASVAIDATVRTGYTWSGWTKSSGTTPTTFTPSTKSQNIVMGAGDVTLTASATGNTYTVTVYYNSNNNSGNFSVATKTAQCIVSNTAGTCSANVPDDVIASVGKYNSTYAGVAASATSNPTKISSITLSANANYYAVYSSKLKIYYPNTSNSISNIDTALYRNEWCSNATCTDMTAKTSNTAPNTSNNDGATQATSVTLSNLKGTFKGLATVVNSTTNYAVNANDIIKSSLTTYYAVTKFDESYSIVYNADTTGASYTRVDSSSSVSSLYYCQSNSVIGITHGTATCAPSTTVTNSIGIFRGPYRGLSRIYDFSNPEIPKVTTCTGGSTYYAYYSQPLTIYYPNTSNGISSSSTALYRNEYVTGDSGMISGNYTVNYNFVTSNNPDRASQVTNVTLPNIKGTFKGLNQDVDVFSYQALDYFATNIYDDNYTTYYAVTTAAEPYSIIYNSNTTSGSFTKATSTTSTVTSTFYCQSQTVMATRHGTAACAPSTTVTNSVGQYNSPYKGLSSSSTGITNVTTCTGGSTYYVYYSQPLTIYYPNTSNGVSSTTPVLYRNEYFSSTTAMNWITATSQTTTTQATTVTLPDMKGTFQGLNATINNTTSANIKAINSDDIIRSNASVYYAVTTAPELYTIVYNSNSTNGSFTRASTSSSVTSTYYCISEYSTGMGTVHGTATCAPASPITNSVGQYNSPYKGLSSSSTTISNTTSCTGGSTYYAYYSKPLTIYYPNTSNGVSSTSTAVYRNEFFNSDTTLNWVTASSQTSTQQLTTSQIVTPNSIGTRVGFTATVNSISNLKDINNNDIVKSNTSVYYSVHTNGEAYNIVYNSNTTNGSFTKETDSSRKVTSHYYCKSTSVMGTTHGSATCSPSTTVTNSIGQYNSPYKGLSSSSTGITNVTSCTGGGTYYAYYSQPLTVYYPNTSNGISNSSTSLYRNEYFSSTNAMNWVTAISQTSTTQATNVTFPSMKGTLQGLNATVNDVTSTNIKAVNSNDIIKSNTITYYAVVTAPEAYTIVYNSNSTYGEFTRATDTSYTVTSTYYCQSTSAMGTTHGSETCSPSTEVTNSYGKYNSHYKGLSDSSSGINNVTSCIGESTYYAYYGGNQDAVSGYTPSKITNYYYNSGSWDSSTIYRYEYFDSDTTMITLFITNSVPASTTGPGSSTFAGIATSTTGGTVFTSYEEAQTPSTEALANFTVLSEVYKFVVTYNKGSHVSSIGATSNSCDVKYNTTSCNVVLPTITASVGYKSVGWSTTNGATTGTAAGQSITISDQTNASYYANAVRTFTCGTVGSNTSYKGKSWYTVGNSNGVCELLLNYTVGTGAFSTATGSSNPTYSTIKSYSDDGGTLEAELNASLITLLDTIPNVDNTGKGLDNTYYWSSSKKVFTATRTITSSLSTTGVTYGFYDKYADNDYPTQVNTKTYSTCNTSNIDKGLVDVPNDTITEYGFYTCSSATQLTQSGTNNKFTSQWAVWYPHTSSTASIVYMHLAINHYNFDNEELYGRRARNYIKLVICGGGNYGKSVVFRPQSTTQYRYQSPGTAVADAVKRNYDTDGVTGTSKTRYKVDGVNYGYYPYRYKDMRYYVFAGGVTNSGTGGDNGTNLGDTWIYDYSSANNCATRNTYSMVNTKKAIGYRPHIKVKI